MNNKHIHRILAILILVLSVGTLNAQDDSNRGCPGIDAGPDTVVNCINTSVTLKASVFATSRNVTQYSVKSIPYAPPYPYTSGTPVPINNTDDIWASPVTMPFKFCFYGITYETVWAGSNGLLTFTQPTQTMCPYAFSSNIPDAGFPVLNAIYGVYQDTHLGIGSGTYMRQGVLGEWPCRMYIVSWNQVPLYSCTTVTGNTYQIVLYEGTNIIDVYVGQRSSCLQFQNGVGLIGIQNSTGTQAMVPPNRNTGSWTAQEEAWRFQAIGDSLVNVTWYEGNTIEDSAEIANNQYTITVAPENTQDYTVRMRYISATDEFYDLSDVVTVRKDTLAEVELSVLENPVCEGEQFSITANVVGEPAKYTWSHDENERHPTISYQAEDAGVDTLSVQVLYRNGCQKMTDIVLTTNPVKDTTFNASICDGGFYHFGDEDIRVGGIYTDSLKTSLGCDSVVTVRLGINHSTQSTDVINSCSSYIWRDSVEYTQSTFEPTYTITNANGCDSVIHLHLTINGLIKAQLKAPDLVTLDERLVRLSDISVGEIKSRRWLLPDGSQSYDSLAYFVFPINRDSVDVRLIVSNTFNCFDTADVTIPMRKESIYIPNAFTPDKYGNELFKIKGFNIAKFEIVIFDRAGEMVYYSDNINEGWDGTKNGQICNKGTYMYKLNYSYEHAPDNIITKKGTILILR